MCGSLFDGVNISATELYHVDPPPYKPCALKVKVTGPVVEGGPQYLSHALISDSEILEGKVGFLWNK